MAKKRIQCDRCGGFFMDSQMNVVVKKPGWFARQLMDAKPEKSFYCDGCIDLVR